MLNVKGIKREKLAVAVEGSLRQNQPELKREPGAHSQWWENKNRRYLLHFQVPWASPPPAELVWGKWGAGSFWRRRQLCIQRLRVWHLPQDLTSNNQVRFVCVCLYVISLCSWNKDFKAGLVCMVSAEHNFITEDLHLPHKPQAFSSCFGQDAALKKSLKCAWQCEIWQEHGLLWINQIIWARYSRSTAWLKLGFITDWMQILLFVSAKKHYKR